ARATAASPGSTSSTPPGTSPTASSSASSSSTSSSASPTSSSGSPTAPLPPYPDARCQLPAERMDGAAHLDHQGAPERLSALDPQARPRLDLALGEVPQHRGVAVGDAGERAGLAGLELAERHGIVRAECQVAVRDRVAMGVERGLSELGGDQLLELLGDVVLQHLGLGVHAVPRHAELLGEEELDQPVVADHLERDPLGRA